MNKQEVTESSKNCSSFSVSSTSAPPEVHPTLSMELHGCGFNGHNQLKTDAERLDDPSDIYSFTKIASGHDIGVAHAGWSQTLGRQQFEIVHFLIVNLI